jgi:hypothetical protein
MTYSFYVEQSVKQNVLEALHLIEDGASDGRKQKTDPEMPAGILPL